MRYSVTLTAKVSPELFELITTVSEQRGEGRSSMVRRAILKELASLSFLPDIQKKALGLSTEEVEI